jgi:hypothetical protein
MLVAECHSDKGGAKGYAPTRSATNTPQQYRERNQVNFHLFFTSSAFALYIERFVYNCGFYFAPFRPSNSDFGCIEEGESTAGSTFTPLCGIFCLPWNLGFTSHSKDEAIEVVK